MVEKDMVETVARAIYDVSPFRENAGPYEDQSDEYRRLCRVYAKAAIAALPGWQDMSTAPKDGRDLLLFVPRRLGDLIAMGSNPTGEQWWARNIGDLAPTHWMPLPTPPTKSEADNGSHLSKGAE